MHARIPRPLDRTLLSNMVGHGDVQQGLAQSSTCHDWISLCLKGWALELRQERPMPDEVIVVEMNAARVCEAVSKIGYSPSSALMDIIDNAITADATRVTVALEIEETARINEKNNCVRYTIADNGKGMSNEAVLNALKLGSDAHYGKNSLSKYGMGLKSAGLSLGKRIRVASRVDSIESLIHRLDKAAIAESGKYIIIRESPGGEKLRYPPLGESGCVIEIDAVNGSSKESAASTFKNLSHRLGVVYHDFIKKNSLAISLIIRKPKKGTLEEVERFEVAPVDLLFLEIAESAYDDDGYSGKLPCRALSADSREMRISTDAAIPPIQLEAVIFPKDEMHTCIHFSEDERRQVKAFRITRENKGFFIYRNGRLIRWGESLDIVGRDALNFRAKISITSEHDDMLGVDVSKQNIDIPEDILDRIASVMATPLRNAEKAKQLCDTIKEKHHKEGETFNAKSQTIIEEDMDAPVTIGKDPEARSRRRLREEEGERVTREDPVESPIPDPQTGAPIFERVRYSDRVASNILWEAGVDAEHGSFVRINKNHPFYILAISHFSDESAARQAVEAFIWCLGSAENKTIEHLTHIPSGQIIEVIERLKKVTSNSLDNWCGRNRDLFSD